MSSVNVSDVGARAGKFKFIKFQSSIKEVILLASCTTMMCLHLQKYDWLVLWLMYTIKLATIKAEEARCSEIFLWVEIPAPDHK